MDKIFYNGCIRTLDDKDTVAQAVGIENGKITFIGTNQEAESISCEDRTDLQGRLLLPGFVDTHMHMLHYAFVEKSVKLFDCKSVEEMLAAAKKKLDESAEQPLTWLYCRGWNEEHFEQPRYPHKEELDALSVDIPIIMVRVCGHVAVCNSCGLERLKKIQQFDEIAKDVDLETGLLKENAVQFYYSVLEAPSQEEIESYIKYSAEKLNESGFTGVQSDDLAALPGKNWRRIMDAYQALDERGELNIRHYEQCLFERAEDAKAFIEEGFRTGQRGDHFTIGPVKLIQDGSLGARTAAMNEPYTDDPQNKGIITFTQEELDDLFAFFDQHQMQAAVHCIGDRAMDMVIEAVAKSPDREKNPKNRHGIVHCQITNQRILEAMKEQDILAYIQPVFIDLDMNTVEPAIGPERMNKIYAWKSMLELGIHTSGGSDAPVVSFDAMENIYFAVTRRNIHGQPEEGWIPSEKMSVDEAVKLFTKNAAYASYTEHENGTIEIGKNADFVVLERDIYEIDPEEIKTTKIEWTILGGKTVYKRAPMEEITRTVEDSKVETVHMVRPNHMNAAGRLFGGQLMQWLDEVAGLVAKRHIKGNVITASVDNLRFIHGAYQGEMVVIIGKATFVANSSMEVRVDTYVEHMENGMRYPINRAYFTMVGLDENDKPMRIPRLKIEGEEQKAEWFAAEKRREMRMQRRKEGF